MAYKRMTPEEKIKALDDELKKLDEEKEAALEQVKKKRKQIMTRKRDETTRARKEEEKLETRRKIISGAIIRKHIAANPDSDVAKLMAGLHDEYVETRDRDLMGLPPLPAPLQSPKNDNLADKFHSSPEKV